MKFSLARQRADLAHLDTTARATRRVAPSLALAAWALVGLGLLVPADGADAQDAQILYVEVRDERGFHPDDLAAADLEIRTPSGIVRTPRILDLPLRRRGGKDEGVHWLVYVDQVLSSRGTVRRAMDSLGALTGPMQGLGEIEIVSARADAAPEILLRTGDPLIASERLSRMALTERGQRALYIIRQRALDEWRTSGTGPVPRTAEERAGIVIQAVEEELELSTERLRRMVGWVGQRPAESERPRVLMPILDGFDLDPVAYWRTVLDETGLAMLEDAVATGTEASPSRVARLRLEVDELSRALAATGWIVMPISIELSAAEKRAEFTAAEDMDPDKDALLPGFTIRPGAGKKDDDTDDGAADEQPLVELIAPRAPLQILADASGGELILTDPALRDAVDRFADRVPIAWSGGLGYADDVVFAEVRPTRPGWSVRARSWFARGVPSAISDLRLDRVLGGREDDGDLSLAAVLEIQGAGSLSDDAAAPTRATLDARLDLGDLEGQEGLESMDLQVTVRSVGLSSESALGTVQVGRRLVREVVEGQNLAVGREWRWRRELELPPDATAVAVLIEEVGTGRWGGRRASVVRADGDLGGDFLPSPTVVEIRRPEDAVLRGRVRFDVDVWDSRVARVRFLLDEREVASQSEPPFSARLDLGRTPRRQELTVVAYDPNGAEIGRDSAILNGGEAGLAVEITSPTDARGVGNVEVAADVSVPVERQLDRVLFFWNNEQVATLYAPPFRQRIFVPEDQKVGYVRVVALLDDGSLAEDVLFLNGPSAGERVTVELVELYVVVAGEDGRPVRGLQESDFRVVEDGRPQQIATFSDAAELPLTLGMAIDSSASMFVKLPKVQQAASDFLRRTFSERDRAFVVDFDSQPRLARGVTSDIERLSDAIWGLEASGRTAMWESIVYSLVQLQGTRGRKALIVFSDGADEDDQFPFRSALRISREMGVPIYLILMKKEPKESAALGLLRRSFTSRVDRLVEATGGRVFYGKEYDDLGQIYEEIEEELRSQYLLAYYPDAESDTRGWRDVDVEIGVEGLEPRTLSGYRQ